MYDFLKHINQDPALNLPTDISSILSEEKSNWAFSFRIRNSTDAIKRIIILTAGIPTNRIVPVSSGTYPAIGGANIPYSGTDTLLQLRDNPLLINMWTNVKAHCVATTTIDGRTQTVYADNSGNVLVENISYNGGMDFLQEFVLAIPVRIFQLQINSNNIEQFAQKIILQAVSPFHAPITTEILIEDWFKPLQNQNKVIITRPVIVGADTVMSIDLPAQTESTFTMKASAIINQRQKLNKATDVADIIKKIQNIKP